MAERGCVVCAAPIPVGSAARYCSHACICRASRARARLRRRRHAQQAALAALAADTPVPDGFSCAHCQRPLAHGHIRADARYCSPACRTAAWRVRAVEHRGQPSRR